MAAPDQYGALAGGSDNGVLVHVGGKLEVRLQAAVTADEAAAGEAPLGLVADGLAAAVELRAELALSSFVPESLTTPGADGLDLLGSYGAGLAALALVTALIGLRLKEPALRTGTAHGSPEPAGKTG